jgi:hypothetical protein
METMNETEPAPIVVYHAFTDNKDLWTRDYKFARKLYNHWKKANGAARLYKEVYEDEEAMLNDEMLDEDCLLTYGPYPL